MNISIIGGGITGLSTALALHKLGVKATVYERAATLNEVGAGVWLQPNAVQICNWLGIKEKLLEAGSPLLKMEIADPHLQPFKKLKKEVVEDEYGNRTIAIHRGRLQKILFDEFSKVGEVKLGKTYESHSHTSDGIKVQFSDSEMTTDMILGADGIHSTVRESLFSDTQIRASNQICWRGISSYKLPKHLLNKGKELWGPNIRFGFSNISANEVYWFAVAENNSENQNRDKDGIKALFQNFAPIVPKIIEQTNDIHTAQLSDLKRLAKWHDNKICLIGDAAHATTPNMGQGACQGIEDAYYISNLLVQNDFSKSAFEVFEQKRRKKVDYIVNTSWRFGQAAHSRMGQFLMKILMKATPENVMSSQMNKLYSVEQF